MKDKRVIKELRKPIAGYEGLYDIDIYGNIYSLKRKKEKKLKHCFSKTSIMPKVTLSKDGKKEHFGVRRLVWETFVGKIPEGKVVGSVVSSKADTFLGNLKLTTRKKLLVEAGKAKQRTVVKVDRFGNEIEIYSSIKECAEEHHVSTATINHLCNGKYKNPYYTFGDFTFKYEEAKNGRKRGNDYED